MEMFLFEKKQSIIGMIKIKRILYDSLRANRELQQLFMSFK